MCQSIPPSYNLTKGSCALLVKLRKHNSNEHRLPGTTITLLLYATFKSESFQMGRHELVVMFSSFLFFLGGRGRGGSNFAHFVHWAFQSMEPCAIKMSLTIYAFQTFLHHWAECLSKKNCFTLRVITAHPLLMPDIVGNEEPSMWWETIKNWPNLRRTKIHRENTKGLFWSLCLKHTFIF